MRDWMGWEIQFIEGQDKAEKSKEVDGNIISIQAMNNSDWLNGGTFRRIFRKPWKTKDIQTGTFWSKHKHFHHAEY